MPGYIEPNMRLLSKRVGFKIALFLFLEDFFSISFIIMLRIPGLKRFIPPIRHVRFYHGKEGMYLFLFFCLLMKFSQYGCSIDAELENFLSDWSQEPKSDVS